MKMVRMNFGETQKKKKIKIGGRTKICCQKWKKSKKIGRKWVLDFLAPPSPQKNNLGGVQIFFVKMKKIKVVQNCLLWRENWPKTGFGLFSPPPPKNVGGLHNIFVKNEKNHSCSRLLELARKLVENEFFGFLTPLYTKRKFEKVLDDKK